MACGLAGLEALPRFSRGPFLFSTTAGAKPVCVGSKIKAVLDARAGVTGWVNHDLRRTVRSGLSALRIDPEAKEAVLAHAKPGIVGVYDHYEYADEKRDALERWTDHVLELVSPPQPAKIASPSERRSRARTR
jgi:integrase